MNAFAAATNALIPLPGFPLPPDSHVSACVGLRRFGIFEDDLSIDFASGNRAALATRILESCTVDPENILPDSFFLELAIGKRIECLLHLAAGGPDAAFGFPLRCAGCGEEIEFELMLREISKMQEEADMRATVNVGIGGRRVKMRKPTGRDQEIWSRMPFRTEHEAAAAMIDTLVELPASWTPLQHGEIDIVDEALNEADPLVDFSCSVHCGECGERIEHLIDLSETALGMLKRAQNQLVEMVHQLASHYHWSEQEIFSVPDWRRRLYLELIGGIRK